MQLASRIRETHAPAAVLIVRLAVAAVFVSEGIQKFLFPAELGAGRFAKIGLPAAEALGPFVGAVEIVGGTLLALGLLTRLVAIPLLVVMLVAITSTKLKVLLDKGFWVAAHEARTDFLMFCSLAFLLVVGAGAISLDARSGSRRGP